MFSHIREAQRSALISLYWFPVSLHREMLWILWNCIYNDKQTNMISNSAQISRGQDCFDGNLYWQCFINILLFHLLKRQLIFINNTSIIPFILNLLDICDHMKANKTIGNIICKNSSCWSFDVVLLCCAREKMFWQVFGNLGSQCVRSKYQILETSILREEI